MQELLLQQQARSATPPLSAAAQLSQLSQLSSMQQDRSLQSTHQLATGQQPVMLPNQPTANGSQLLGSAGSQQSLGTGGSSQQISGLGLGSNLQQAKGVLPSPQHTLSSVKVEPQSLGQPLQHQQQLLMPKVEIKTEAELDQKVS